MDGIEAIGLTTRVSRFPGEHDARLLTTPRRPDGDAGRVPDAAAILSVPPFQRLRRDDASKSPKVSGMVYDNFLTQFPMGTLAGPMAPGSPALGDLLDMGGPGRPAPGRPYPTGMDT